jgi:hypothetical protein
VVPGSDGSSRGLLPEQEPPLALVSYVNNATEGVLFRAGGKILRGQ